MLIDFPPVDAFGGAEVIVLGNRSQVRVTDDGETV